MRLQRSSELPKPESLVSDNLRESNNYVVDYSTYADYKRPSTSSGLTGLAAQGYDRYDYSLNSRAGYGGCVCMDQGGGDAGGLLGGGTGDLGLLAAGAGAVFLLYQQIIMLMMRRRKRSSLTTGGNTKMGETSADQLSTDLEDILKGRICFICTYQLKAFS